MKTSPDLFPKTPIEKKIFLLRGQKVMLSVHLAELYGVETRVLNQAVKRNMARFPPDFMFQLTWQEARSLRSQFVILEEPGQRRGRHAKFRMFAFTEQGVAMLASVLKSERAIQVNIAIMRAFVRLREILSTHKVLALKLKQLEMKIENDDADIQAIFEAIRQLVAPPPPTPKQRMGFHLDEVGARRGVGTLISAIRLPGLMRNF